MPKYVKASEFQNLPNRFVAVRQGNTNVRRLQDLQGANRLMTNAEILKQSGEIGKQTQATLAAGRAFGERTRRENIAAGEKRYGPGFSASVTQRAQEISKRTQEEIKTNIEAKRTSPEYQSAIKAEAERRVDARLAPENVATSSALGYDVASSRSRTQDVLAQSQRAERMADEMRKKQEKLKNQPQLARESVDYFKNRLNEGIMRTLGRAFGRYVARPVGAAANIPGVKPLVRTAAVGAAVAGGAYAYNKYLKSDKPQIDKSAIGAKGSQASGKQKTGGAYSTPTIVPVERKGGDATRKYAEMMREPGGVAGSMRKKRAEEIWKQWQEEDKNK